MARVNVDILGTSELKWKLKFIDITGDSAKFFSLFNEYIPIMTFFAKGLKRMSSSFNLVSTAQNAYNGVIIWGQRALYIYQMQVLLARAAIATTTGATKAMNIAIASSPYLIAAAAAATLGIAIYKLALGNSETAKAQKRLDEAMTDMNKEVSTEQNSLDTLFGGYWWLPLPILQNTILIAVNQPLADFCFVTQNQRGTKTGQNHGKIKSRTLRPKYPLWNTSVSFAKVQICPLKNEGKSLFLSFTTHFPTIVPQMWLLQTVLTSNSMTCENRVLNFVLHSDGHFQKRELAIEPNICHPYCPIFGFVIV